MIQSFFSKLRLAKFMLTLDLAGNTAKMNVASPVVDVLLRRYLLQNHLLLNLAIMKSKRCYHRENINKASQNLY